MMIFGDGSPEAATAELARMVAAERGPAAGAVPQTAKEAQARLDSLMTNAEWGRRLSAHDDAARTEFEGLTKLIASAGDPVEMAIAGLVPHEETTIDESGHGAKASGRMMAAGVVGMRNMGLSDETIRDVLNDRPVARTLHRDATVWFARHLADTEWVKRFNAHDVRAVEEFAAATAITNARIAA
jgi:hypothetical protein